MLVLNVKIGKMINMITSIVVQSVLEEREKERKES